jgi:hypothetical protein
MLSFIRTAILSGMDKGLDNKNFTIRPELSFFCFIVGIYVFFIFIVILSRGTLATKSILLIGFAALMTLMFYRAYFKNIITVYGTTLTFITLPQAGMRRITNRVVALEFSTIRDVGIDKALLVITDVSGRKYAMKTGVFSRTKLLQLESILKSYGIHVTTHL